MAIENVAYAIGFAKPYSDEYESIQFRFEDDGEFYETSFALDSKGNYYTMGLVQCIQIEVPEQKEHYHPCTNEFTDEALLDIAKAVASFPVVKDELLEAFNVPMQVENLYIVRNAPYKPTRWK